MPTYQYACTECGHQFEQVQSFSDSALTQCPVCEGRLRKVYNAVGVVFKGSGFYRNDSRSTTGGESASGAKDASAKDSGSGDSGSKDAPAKGAAAKDSSSSPSTTAPASSSTSKSSGSSDS